MAGTMVTVIFFVIFFHRWGAAAVCADGHGEVGGGDGVVNIVSLHAREDGLSNGAEIVAIGAVLREL
jgi:hypothetical protein